MYYFMLTKIFLKTPFLTLERKKVQYLTFYIIKNDLKRKNKMTTFANEKQTSIQLALVSFSTSFQKIYCFFNVLFISEEEKIQVIIRHWIRTLQIKFGWINEFDKLIVNYIYNLFMFDTFQASSKLINSFIGHPSCVYSIDYSTFDDCQFICSGSNDKTVSVWDIDNNKQIQSFNGHFRSVTCVKFSSYHYRNHHQNVIFSSSHDKNIRSWDFKHNKPLQILNGHTDFISCIKFSSFNGGRYLCSASYDRTIRLWDVETSKQLHVFNGHECGIWSIDFSSLQRNYNNDNNIGVIGGNGYKICSGSGDNTIRIWDIETYKQCNVFKGHEDIVMSVKYGSNELLNTILS
ncbi:WD repeat-containing protein [Reticulomyxa filosa]|uniref:WD repeat-containing protein n=1 Tax=Reticulomyxa filosa TaxID=46433 RepID=X6MKT2_RETFI|nr:WD repeat-containing protein [Reticulomyxa filosa]|eukprot:ETO14623.1 WD repeat-containing protein [Reticulomyxa filosa]